MSQYKAPITDMNFLLFDVFKAQDFWAQNEILNEAIEPETAKAILEESAKVTEQAIAPFSREADETGVSWADGTVTTPASYKEAFNVVAEGGWIGLAGDPEYGGMGMPKTLAGMHEEMMCSADLAFALYPGLTSGACLAIRAHANEELKQMYLPNLYSGVWAGSMCLTEAHAGTDLGLIKTKAEPQEDGSYQISGSKIFITGGEQDLSENIVHLVLAKLPDAPEGSRGITLFIVPKFHVKADGSLGNQNAVSCGSIEHKMGIHGSSTCVMNFDGAKGYLVGEVNKGLACMFTMMNYERLFVGLQGLGAAERSYQNALAYALDRGQGKGSPRMSDGVTDPIIVHADVRRMLLNMKAMNEAGRAFATYVSTQLDEAKYNTDLESQKRADARAQLLTPIAKAFLTDMALETCITGQQVFGGHGYVREWGQEQLVRDTRITQIYEGTNGIQAMDLIGRKVAANKGQTAELLMSEISYFIELSINDLPELKALERAVMDLSSVTESVIARANDDVNELGAAAVDYLHMFGYVMYGYMWAKMMVAVENHENTGFKSSKLRTGRFYLSRILPKVKSLKSQIESGAIPLYELAVEDF